MNRPIFWLSSGVSAIVIAVCAHAIFQGSPEPDGTGAPATGSIEPIVGFPFAEEKEVSGPATNYSSVRNGDCSPTTVGAPSDTGSGEGLSRGIGSFYEVNTNGTGTASGIPLDDSTSTAAHRTLPFGTLVQVTNLGNGLCETVVITDRGPFVNGRIIDVSRNAAEKLGMVESGVVPVEIEVLAEGSKP